MSSDSVDGNGLMDRKLLSKVTLHRPQMKLAHLASICLAVILLGVAELAARESWVSDFILPTPSSTWNALMEGFGSGQLIRHGSSTLFATGMGFVAATVLGLGFATVLTAIPFLRSTLMPFVVAVQSLPKIAIAPMVVLWLGFGLNGKIAVVTIVSFFPIFINSLQGLQLRDEDQHNLMRSLNASRMQLFLHLRLPGGLPFIFAGLQIGIIFSLIGTIVAEFVGSSSGLGYLLLQARALFHVPEAFAILVLLMIMGLVLDSVMTVLERRLTPWARDVTQISP